MKNDTTMHIAMTSELKEKIQEKARKKNISLNSLVRLILTEYLEGEK